MSDGTRVSTFHRLLAHGSVVLLIADSNVEEEVELVFSLRVPLLSALE
jgi:hypothetical protein